MKPLRRARAGRFYWSTVAFFAGCVLILLLVMHRYLIPVLALSQDMDAAGRKQLAAISALVLIVVLVCLLGAMILAIRPGRFFLPGKTPPRTRTTYTDAWSESARRMPDPPKDDADDE